MRQYGSFECKYGPRFSDEDFDLFLAKQISLQPFGENLTDFTYEEEEENKQE